MGENIARVCEINYVFQAFGGRNPKDEFSRKINADKNRVRMIYRVYG
jgi:hypothetical protein